MLSASRGIGAIAYLLIIFPPLPFAVLHKKGGLKLMTAMATAWVHLLSHLKVLYPKWNWLLPAVFVAVYSGAQLKQPKLCTNT